MNVCEDCPKVGYPTNKTRCLPCPRRPDRPREFLAWAAEIFGPVALERRERLLRFLEEALEVAHADGLDLLQVDLLVTRVWRKDPCQDEIPKEIGQAQACLEIYAESIGLSSDDQADIEWDRVRSIPKEEWTHRHSAKVALGIAQRS